MHQRSTRSFCNLRSLAACVRARLFRLPCIVAVVVCAPAIAAETDPASEAANVLNELVTSRSRLVRGKFVAIGRIVTLNKEHRINDEFPSSVSCEFDHEHQCFRFVTKERHRSTLAPSSDLHQGKSVQTLADEYSSSGAHKLRDSISMLVRNPNYMAEWFAIGRQDRTDRAQSNIQLFDRSARSKSRLLHSFDVAAAGVITVREFSLGTSLSDIVAEVLRTFPISTVESDPNGDVRAQFVIGSLKKVITIAKDYGYTVRRMEQFELDANGKRKEFPYHEATATWKEYPGEVWVPESLTVSHHRGPETYKLVEYDLDWEAVNPDTVDESRFAYQSFEGVWDGTAVIERRNKQRVHIDTIGRPFVQIPFAADVEAATNLPIAAKDVRKERRSIGLWLLAVNGVAVLVIVVVVWLRRARRAH